MQIKQLWLENEKLKAENAELRRRLGMDSKNSHIPPSSEGYKKKPKKPGIPKGKGKETRLSKSNFPTECPYTISEILDENFYPESKE